MGEKLIRQNIELDDTAVTRKAEPRELDRLLGAKLVEEARELQEVLETPLGDPQNTLGGKLDGRRNRIVDEAADLMEVLNTVLHRHAIPGVAVESRIERHNAQRGGFFDRVLVNTTGELVRPGDVGANIAPAVAADVVAWDSWLTAWHVTRPLRFKLSAHSNGARVFIRIESEQPDAALPEAARRPIQLRVDVAVPSAAPDETSPRWLRALLRWFVLHELDHWIYVNGECIFDPHRDGRTPTPENS
jgi:predicted house-cleaning noncanonical NTP pyrophosphatase (MazG superfamily)